MHPSMWFCMKWHGAWFYGIHRMCWDGSSFDMAPAINQPVLQIHHFSGYSKCTIKKLQLLLQNRCNKSAGSAQKQRTALYKSNQQLTQEKTAAPKHKNHTEKYCLPGHSGLTVYWSVLSRARLPFSTTCFWLALLVSIRKRLGARSSPMMRRFTTLNGLCKKKKSRSVISLPLFMVAYLNICQKKCANSGMKRASTHAHAHTHALMHARNNTHTHMRIHPRTGVHTHTHMCTHTHTHMHRHTKAKNQTTPNPYLSVTVWDSDGVDWGACSEVFTKAERARAVAEGGSLQVVHHIHDDSGTDCLLQWWGAPISDSHLPLKMKKKCLSQNAGKKQASN